MLPVELVSKWGQLQSYPVRLDRPQSIEQRNKSCVDPMFSSQDPCGGPPYNIHQLSNPPSHVSYIREWEVIFNHFHLKIFTQTVLWLFLQQWTPFEDTCVAPGELCHLVDMEIISDSENLQAPKQLTSVLYPAIRGNGPENREESFLCGEQGRCHAFCNSPGIFIFGVALLREMFPLHPQSPLLPNSGAQRLLWRKGILHNFNEIIKEDEVWICFVGTK